jgi:hypothetical protein
MRCSTPACRCGPTAVRAAASRCRPATAAVYRCPPARPRRCWSAHPAPPVRSAWVDRPGKPTGDGPTELTLTFERVEYAYADLVPLAGAIEVIAPLELRTRLAAAGRGLAARYAS